MENLTYERRENNSKLETYEWDRTWIDNADDNKRTRVLYVGDSISCRVVEVATKVSGDAISFDGFHTSKALDNKYLKEYLKVFTSQEGYRSVILFNNGLHGWHLDDKTEYPEYYRDMVEFLQNEFCGTPVILVLTTTVADLDREERVKVRNEQVIKIAKSMNLPVIDLYSLSCKHVDLRSEDGVHFKKEGYEKFAELIISAVKNYL